MTVLTIVAFLFAVFFYLFPSFLAGLNHKKNNGWICVVNLLTGWTVIGWVCCLVWALSAEKMTAAGEPAKHTVKDWVLGVGFLGAIVLVGVAFIFLSTWKS